MGGNINYKINSKIENVIRINGYSKDIASTINNLFNYMIEHDYRGCCHSFSSILYVALSEFGLSPKLFVGECSVNSNPPFDHSWITLDNKIIDIAIFMPLISTYKFVNGPIILDKDVLTNKMHHINYGINTGMPWSNEAEKIMKIPFSEYMSSCPWEENGLWTVLQKILPNTISIDIEQLKEKYKETKRIVAR